MNLTAFDRCWSSMVCENRFVRSEFSFLGLVSRTRKGSSRKKRSSKLGRAYREADLPLATNKPPGREKNALDRLFNRVSIVGTRRSISRSGDRGFEAP